MTAGECPPGALLRGQMAALVLDAAPLVVVLSANDAYGGRRLMLTSGIDLTMSVHHLT